MKNLKKLLCVLVFLISILFAFTTSFLCFADSDKGNVTVELKCEQQSVEDGFCIYFSKIADYVNGEFKAAHEFEKTEISVTEILENPTEKIAKQVEKIVLKNKISSFETASKNGQARFADIECGIWLVYCENTGEYTFNPYFIFLPFLNDDKAEYNVKTSPKISKNSADSISINVRKLWDDRNNKAKKRPDYVTIELKLDGETIETAMLSQQNGWEYTFTELVKGKYSVKEKSVKNYTAKYDGDSKNGFVVTNVYNYGKLPQTGQLWWPVVILLVAGVGFVVLGIIELGVKKNAKKSK